MPYDVERNPSSKGLEEERRILMTFPGSVFFLDEVIKVLLFIITWLIRGKPFYVIMKMIRDKGAYQDRLLEEVERLIQEAKEKY